MFVPSRSNPCNKQHSYQCPLLLGSLKQLRGGSQKSPTSAERQRVQSFLTSFALNGCISSKNMSDWSSGLCACFENVGICIKTYFCPCIVAGKIGEALGEGCCYHGFCSLMGPIGIYCGAQNRGKIREKYQIPVSWSLLCLLGERNIYDWKTSQRISLSCDIILDHKMLVFFELPLLSHSCFSFTIPKSYITRDTFFCCKMLCSI